MCLFDVDQVLDFHLESPVLPNEKPHCLRVEEQLVVSVVLFSHVEIRLEQVYHLEKEKVKNSGQQFFPQAVDLLSEEGVVFPLKPAQVVLSQLFIDLFQREGFESFQKHQLLQVLVDYFLFLGIPQLARENSMGDYLYKAVHLQRSNSHCSQFLEGLLEDLDQFFVVFVVFPDFPFEFVELLFQLQILGEVQSAAGPEENIHVQLAVIVNGLTENGLKTLFGQTVYLQVLGKESLPEFIQGSGFDEAHHFCFVPLLILFLPLGLLCHQILVLHNQLLDFVEKRLVEEVHFLVGVQTVEEGVSVELFLQNSLRSGLRSRQRLRLALYPLLVYKLKEALVVQLDIELVLLDQENGITEQLTEHIAPKQLEHLVEVLGHQNLDGHVEVHFNHGIGLKTLDLHSVFLVLSLNVGLDHIPQTRLLILLPV